MSMQDTIADMITRLRNAQMRNLFSTKVINTKINRAILQVLKTEGYIAAFAETEDKRETEVQLKYDQNNQPIIRDISRVSKSSRREYTDVTSLRKEKLCQGLGTRILSTTKGVLTDAEAISQNVGGEILCQVIV
jgi:small subunit ribosomal protein S8